MYIIAVSNNQGPPVIIHMDNWEQAWENFFLFVSVKTAVSCKAYMNGVEMGRMMYFPRTNRLTN